MARSTRAALDRAIATCTRASEVQHSAAKLFSAAGDLDKAARASARAATAEEQLDELLVKRTLWYPRA